MRGPKHFVPASCVCGAARRTDGYGLGAINAFMMWPARKASNAVSASGSGVMTLVSQLAGREHCDARSNSSV